MDGPGHVGEVDRLGKGARLGFGPQQIISSQAGKLHAIFESSLDDKIAWYANTDGAGSFGPQQIISSLAESAQSVFAADLDGDEDVDVGTATLRPRSVANAEGRDGGDVRYPRQLAEDREVLDGLRHAELPISGYGRKLGFSVTWYTTSLPE